MEQAQSQTYEAQAEANAQGGDRLVSVAASIQDGAEAKILRVESCFGRGFAGLQLIGNIGQIVEDGKERARMALERLGLSVPARRLMISISPGDIKVEGNHLDLACAIAIAGQVIEAKPKIETVRWVFAAEIGLGGELRPVPGAVCHGVAAMAGGMEGVVVAHDNLPELQALEAVSLRTGSRVVYRSFRHVSEVIDWLWDGVEPCSEIAVCESAGLGQVAQAARPNFNDMELSDEMRYAAMAAAAGMHSLYLRGAPGSGKSMFAERLVSLLPDLDPEEHLQTLQIHSAHPEPIKSSILAGKPPYRAPHHFVSTAAMLGSGPRPGEIALANGGLLFLDEFPEFRRDVIEALREPLETGEVRVSRALVKRVWRAKIMFVAAANNCPCGWRGSSLKRCQCGEIKSASYQNRISGPILDRIDMHLNMPERSGQAVGLLGSSLSQVGLSADAMRGQVTAAREFAKERNLVLGCRVNRDLPANRLPEALGWEALKLDAVLKKIVPPHASVRATIRCLRVARSLADIHGRAVACTEDIEAAWRWQAHEAARQRGDFVEYRPL